MRLQRGGRHALALQGVPEPASSLLTGPEPLGDPVPQLGRQRAAQRAPQAAFLCDRVAALASHAIMHSK